MADREPLVIAGHYFLDGVCTRDDGDGHYCGRRLCDILCYGTPHEGDEGIAHSGKLAHFEAMQIETEANAQREAIDAAMGWHATPIVDDDNDF